MRKRWRPSSASARCSLRPASRPPCSPHPNSRGRSLVCAAGSAGGLLVPDDLVVYPPVVARYLLDQALSAGAEIRTRARVVQLHNDGRVQLHDGTTIRARLVINATGSWAPSLSPGLPIRPRKGHLVITDRYPGFVRHQLIELGYLKSAHAADRESVAFNIQPRKTGQLLIGSSRQFDAEGTEVEMRLVKKMVRRAAAFLPGVIDLVADAHVGRAPSRHAGQASVDRAERGQRSSVVGHGP